MEKVNYQCIDKEHNTYQCTGCGHIVNFEADGPYENGVDYCAHCGREITHPFRCECGYTGDLEPIEFNIPTGHPHIAQRVRLPGLCCCPECRTVKFIKAYGER